MNELATTILQQLYELDPGGVDRAARQVGASTWLDLVRGLSFEAWDTGGGCMMLLAELPGMGTYRLGITNGDAELPTDAGTFWVGIMDDESHELYSSFVTAGRLAGA